MSPKVSSVIIPGKVEVRKGPVWPTTYQKECAGESNNQDPPKQDHNKGKLGAESGCREQCGSGETTYHIAPSMVLLGGNKRLGHKQNTIMETWCRLSISTWSWTSLSLQFIFLIMGDEMSLSSDELRTILQLPRGIVCPQPRAVYVTLSTDISNHCKKENATFQCVKQAVPSAPRKPILRGFMLGSSVARPYLESLGTFRSPTADLLMAICGVSTAGSHPQRATYSLFTVSHIWRMPFKNNPLYPNSL